MENFGTAHPPGEKGSSEPVQSRKSRSDGSGNAHASKTTKRGAAGFGVVFPARKTWASPQYGRNENLGHGYVNIGGNKSVENFVFG